MQQEEFLHDIREVVKEGSKAKAKAVPVAALDYRTEEDIDECTVPLFGRTKQFELPECPAGSFQPLVELISGMEKLN